MSTNRRRRHRRGSNRDGLSLVELTVAITFLGVVLTSVAGLMVESAQRAQVVATQSRRQAAMAEEVNRITAAPWNLLTPGLATCRVVNDPGFVHSRCISITSITTFMRRIQLVVNPNQLGIAPDTVTFIRAKPPVLNPLNS